MGTSEFYGGSDEESGLAVIRHALDLGVTLLDTADMYGPHDDERLVFSSRGSWSGRRT